MRWIFYSFGIGFGVLLGFNLLLVGSTGCSGGTGKGADITFQLSDQFPKTGDPVVITVKATDKEGKPVASGSTISLTASAGKFKPSGLPQINVTANNEGAATAEYVAPDAQGAVIITGKSEFATNNVTLIVLERELPPEPQPEAAPESKDSGGPEPEIEAAPAAIVFLKIELTSRDTKLTADGQKTTEITAKIMEPKLPLLELQNMKLVFRTSLGTLLDFETKQPLTEIKGSNGEYEVGYSKGSFRVLLRAGIRAGTAIVEAGISNNTYDGVSKAQVNIVALGFIEFQKIDPDTIGTQGSGKEVTTVSVKVLDTNNEEFPEGTRVYFSLPNPIGGASITTSEALTNNKGIAFTQVKSGYSVGTVEVLAQVALEVPVDISKCPAKCTSDADCNTCGYRCHLGACKQVIEATSTSIAIVGGRPSYRGLTFSCENRNVGAFIGSIGANVVNTINTLCTVKLADRFTNKVGFSTQVLFMAEAGAIDASAATAAGTGGGGPGTGNVGTVTVSFRTQNPPPADVDPLSVPNVDNCKDPQCTQPQNDGYWLPYNCTKASHLAGQTTLYTEPWYTDAFGRVRNPRDGLVTVVAYTNGEEQFTDLNNNGRYDVGEPFVDLGEPYIDVNDNGKWDARLPGYPNGEPFIDIPCTVQQAKTGANGCKVAGEGNGRRDGPNGVWDENTLIWKKTWILWTGCHSGTLPQVQPAINLRTCTAIPFQASGYRLKAAAKRTINPDPNDSYGLNEYEALTTTNAFVVEPKAPAELKFLWVDENLNPLTPESTANYTVAGVTSRVAPTDNKVLSNNLTLFGFHPHTLLLPSTGSAFIEDLVIQPTSFVGVLYPQLWSHQVILEDSDQKKAPEAAKINLGVELKVNSSGTGGGLSGCTHGFIYQGESY